MRVQLIVTFDTPAIFENDDIGRKTYSDTFVNRMGRYLVETEALNVNISGMDLDPAVLDIITKRKQ